VCGVTLREVGKKYGSRYEGDFVGTAAEIADGFEQWFTEGGCDGFTVAAVYQPLAFDEFADATVPELQRRGLFRTDYTGATLRGNLGLARPASGDWTKRAAAVPSRTQPRTAAKQEASQ